MLFNLVPDDAPVGRDLLPEDCVFHESAVSGDAVEALAHRLRVARELDVDVAAVAVGHCVNLFLKVHLGRIESNDVGSALLGYFQLGRRRLCTSNYLVFNYLFSHLPIEYIQRNNLCGILLDRSGNGADTEWAASTDHDHV